MKKSERALRLAVLGIAFAGLSACTQIDNALASVPVFAFLREAPSIDPYEMPRMPPPGAIPKLPAVLDSIGMDVREPIQRDGLDRGIPSLRQRREADVDLVCVLVDRRDPLERLERSGGVAPSESRPAT